MDQALEQGDRELGGERPDRPARAWGLGLVTPALVFTALFFVTPLLLVLGYSVMGYADGRVVFTPTLTQYVTLLGDPFYLGIVARTFVIAVTTTAACIILGYPVAYQIAHASARVRPLLVMGVVAPLLIGGVVRGYGWILILDQRGLVNSTLLTLGLVEAPVKLLFNFFGVVVTLVEVLLPFFILPLVGVLSGIDPALERAALSVGASRAQAFARVTLPLSLPGVVAGGSIVFSLACNIFVIPRIIGGPSYLLLSTLAYQQIGEVGNWPFGSAVAAVMLVITLAVLVAGNRAVTARIRRAETVNA